MTTSPQPIAADDLVRKGGDPTIWRVTQVWSDRLDRMYASVISPNGIPSCFPLAILTLVDKSQDY